MSANLVRGRCPVRLVIYEVTEISWETNSRTGAHWRSEERFNSKVRVFIGGTQGLVALYSMK